LVGINEICQKHHVPTGVNNLHVIHYMSVQPLLWKSKRSFLRSDHMTVDAVGYCFLWIFVEAVCIQWSREEKSSAL
jgi:hypothetical protein